MGSAHKGKREAHKFTLTKVNKYMRYIEAMTTTMASVVKNSFAVAMANGGAEPQDYVPHLSDFMARANGIDRQSR